MWRGVDGPGVDLLRMHGTDVHPVPEEMARMAAAAWAEAGRQLDAGLELLGKHRAESPGCPGDWCPGTEVEGSLQQMEPWQLQALLAVAMQRLWAAAHPAARCTGTSSTWCPIHGDCRCPPPREHLDDPACPLHARESEHGNDELEEVR